MEPPLTMPNPRPHYKDFTAASLPALTTAFAPPSYCLAPIYTLSSGSLGFVDVVSPTGIVSRGFRPECFPPHYYEASVTESPGNYGIRQAAIYSPGVCPSGYDTAQFVYSSARNTVTCCPSGMTADETADVDCTGPAATVTVISGTSTWQETVATVIAHSIVVAFAPSDQSLFLAVTSGPTTTQAVPTASDSPGDGPSSSGLSTGTQIGIGLSVAIGILLISAAVIVLLLRRKERKASGETTELGTITNAHQEHIFHDTGSRSLKAASIKTTDIEDEDWAGWEMASRART